MALKTTQPDVKTSVYWCKSNIFAYGKSTARTYFEGLQYSYFEALFPLLVMATCLPYLPWGLGGEGHLRASAPLAYEDTVLLLHRHLEVGANLNAVAQLD